MAEYEYTEYIVRETTYNGATKQEVVGEIVRCKDCLYYDCPHVEKDGKRYEYAEMPKEAFDTLGTGLVTVEYGINVGGMCCADYTKWHTDDKRVFRHDDDYCSRGERRDDNG